MQSYAVLDPVSQAYPTVQGRLPTCYSPVRRSCTPKGLTARLACVKHAASVRPEPGSNSPIWPCLNRGTPEQSIWHHSLKGTLKDRVQKSISSTSIIGTLLSSQRTRAHRHTPGMHGTGQIFRSQAVGFPIRYRSPLATNDRWSLCRSRSAAKA